MRPRILIPSIYLGDRYCKGIYFDSECERITIIVDEVSRVIDGEWNYYTAEDIKNAKIVFEEISRLSINADGFFPNDYIEIEHDNDSFAQEYDKISVLAGCVDSTGRSTELKLSFNCRIAFILDEENNRIEWESK